MLNKTRAMSVPRIMRDWQNADVPSHARKEEHHGAFVDACSGTIWNAR